MPKQKKKTRKAMKRDRSPSLQVSEPAAELHLPTPTDDDVPEPTLSKDSTCDTAFPPSQTDSKKRAKETNVILSDANEERVVEWLADHRLMFNKKIKEYKETDKKDKLWDELGGELGFTGRHKFKFYFLLGPLYCRMYEVIRSICI